MAPSEPPAHRPAWQRVTEGEHRFGRATAVLVLIVVHAFVPVGPGPGLRWMLPAIEAALFVVLLIGNPVRLNRESTLLRAAGIALLVVAGAATLSSAARLALSLVRGTSGNDATNLLLHAAATWLTIMIVFALLYWEFDRGGPAARANARDPYPDFLFPQMASPELAPKDWEPTFVDYLYVSLTNTTAFSPTDTMPLSRWAKLAMGLQSAGSLVLVTLVIARAVNIMA